MTVKYYVTFSDRLKGGFIIWKLYNIAWLLDRMVPYHKGLHASIRVCNIADRMREDLTLKYFGYTFTHVCFNWKCMYTCPQEYWDRL